MSSPDKAPILGPEDAWRRLRDRLSPLGAEEVAREDAAGRILAEPLGATVDMPQADVSAMDGYACAGEVAAGRPLPVAGTVVAGEAPGFDLPAGAACKIMTGAVVPAAADRVIPVEQTDGGAVEVTFHRAPGKGDHIRRCGEVLRRGDGLLDAGVRLTPGAISLLASHGWSRVSVFRVPRVAVITTGDEVVAADREPAPGQLRDSNSHFLGAAGRTLGLGFRSLGIAPDTPDRLRELVARGLGFDVLLLSGGVSMGELDLVEGTLAELGCEVIFDKVAVQPGKPLVAARFVPSRSPHGKASGGCWVFGLPGNPASVMVTFWLFVRPLLRTLMGCRDDGFWRGALTAELAAPLPGAKGRDRFLPATVSFDHGALRVSPLAPRGSHDIVAYAHGSVLVRVPAGAAPAAPGAPCEILPLVDWPGP